ncbi:recombinase family protein [Pseudoduganella sp. FT55W]|uniref:Recombinase family protein n=2 Tax=Duganella rivi TaxID=2666083 RepID=A0A7X4KDR0_9BURK|nr:recombinase family protein [Duganella rivi]
MRIGYARVSTVDQNLDLQRDALTRSGCAQIYQDKASSRTTKARPELENMRRALRPGDTLVVWRLDRLGGNVNDLITIVNELMAAGIEFESLTESIDTKTPHGRMFFTVMAAMNQYRLDVIHENTMAGLKAARARGRVGGRPPALDEKGVSDAKAMISGGMTMADVAARLNISRATLYNTLNRAEAADAKTAASAAEVKGTKKKKAG